MMRTDVEGSDEVSCYGDFVYRSRGDTTHSNQYVYLRYIPLSRSLLDEIQSCVL